MSSRILLFSPRGLRMEVFRSFDYEMEDFVASVEDVEWYIPEQKHQSSARQHWFEGISRRTLKFPWNPAFRMPPIIGDHDLFYVQCMFIWDLNYIARIPDWTGKVKKSVIYITELFLSDIADNPPILDVLKRFDLILISFSGTVERLQELTGVKTVFCTSGVNALKIAPGPDTFHRPVELHSMGRCNQVFFREFQRLVDQHDWTYIYNVFKLTTLDDYRLNRKFLCDLMKRTMFFEVNPAKFDGDVESKNQHEFGYRYFEGIASGCILVGLPNLNLNFNQVFPWEEVLIQLPDTTKEIGPFLLDLYQQKDRLKSISRRNVHGALSYHDFAHRWEFTIKQMGLEPTDALLQRKEQLTQEAVKYV
jgi:hypothetical protein